MADRRSTSTATQTVTVPVSAVATAGLRRRDAIETVAHAVLSIAVIACSTILGWRGILTQTEIVAVWGTALTSSGAVVVVHRGRSRATNGED